MGEPETTAPQTPVVRPVVRSAAGSAAVVILNPFALETMKPEDQKRVRQEAAQTGLPILEKSQGVYQQIITNPFVRSHPRERAG